MAKAAIGPTGVTLELTGKQKKEREKQATLSLACLRKKRASNAVTSTRMGLCSFGPTDGRKSRTNAQNSNFGTNGSYHDGTLNVVNNCSHTSSIGPAVSSAVPLFPALTVKSKNSGSAAAMKEQKRIRIMCLYSDTGGGHRASAEALKNACEQLFGKRNVKFDVVDLWSEVAPYPLTLLPQTYSFMVQHPFLWRFNYTSFYPKAVHQPVLASVSSLIGSRFARAFREYAPHLVVSVHPLLNHAPIRVLNALAKRRNATRPPFVTVVTDLTSCHSTWFCTRVDKCFVPTEEVRRRAKAYGLSDEQIVLHGLPIRPMFSGRVLNQRWLRSRLHIDTNAPTVLLVGGAEGMGKLEKTAVELGTTLPPHAQLIVICGRNKRLKERLESHSYTCKVVIVGFVGNMHEWMGASDCIVTKAGPGTIAEALTRGLPIILNGRIPCQEEGNIPWVLNNGVGTYETEPSRIAQTASNWLTAGETELRRMSDRARALSMPRATFDIARDLEAIARDYRDRMVLHVAGNGKNTYAAQSRSSNSPAVHGFQSR